MPRMGSPVNFCTAFVLTALLCSTSYAHSLVKSSTQIQEILQHEGRLLQERTLSTTAARSYAVGNPAGWQPFFQVGLLEVED